MIDLNRLISGDISEYSKEEIAYIEKFRAILRELLIDEVVKNKNANKYELPEHIVITVDK